MSTTLVHSFTNLEPQLASSDQLPSSPGEDDGIVLASRGEPQRATGKDLSATPQLDLQRTLDRELRDIEDSPQNPTEPPAKSFVALPSLSDSKINKYRLIACCLINFTGGLTDAAPGALIPSMEAHYNIGYAVVSLIFVGMALGFIIAAPFIDTLQSMLGRSKLIALSEMILILGYLPLVLTAPFASVVVGYFFIGFGAAVPLAMNNVYCANMRNGTTMLGLMHGSYGIGGTIAPLIATALVSKANVVWGRFYLITVGFAVINAIVGSWAFWNYEKEQTGATSEQTLSQQEQPASNRLHSRDRLVGMFHAFRLRVALLGALFIFAYQGAEVSISGWVISFLIATRNGDPASIGYVTAGFWAGITIGRFVLSPVGSKIGEKLFVYLLILGATVFQLLVWLVPNIIAESVSLAFVGLLLGPVYPCAAAVFARNFAREEQVAGLSLISAFGTSGGAVAPFTTGLLAQAAGTFVLHPIAIGLFAVMAITWFGQPDKRKRTE